METATTRQLIAVLLAISFGLIFAVVSMGCADVERMHPALKRTLDDKTKWSP